jgi:SAM-dependent methyltransferase
LDDLRSRNAARILDLLAAYVTLDGARLLDVGCAYGWFLEAACERGALAEGIEPEERIARAALSRGCRVAEGFFPQAVPAGHRFQVICFNDVLEHIPDPGAIVRACHAQLEDNGLLSVAIPLHTGFIYRCATWLRKLGVRGPFERMWQKFFHSPHVSYFSVNSLDGLVLGRGFERVGYQKLPSVMLRGLWARLRYDRAASLPESVLVWVSVVLAYPVLLLAPADIGHFVYRKCPAPKQI